jgi:hypothetical protein
MEQTQIIELEDGLRIEAEYATSQVSAITEEIHKRVDAIRPMLIRVVKPIADAWADLNEMVVLDNVELEVGFGIETTGNFFVASSKGNVNLKIKMVVSRRKEQQ